MAGVFKPYAEQECIRYFQEKASGGFAKGDLVYTDDTSGQIAICGADPANILGIAQKAVTGTAGTMIPVDVIRPGDEVVMTYSTTTTQAAIGDSIGIVTTTGALTADATDTSNKRVTLHSLWKGDAGTATQYVVTFIGKYLEYDGNNVA